MGGRPRAVWQMKWPTVGPTLPFLFLQGEAVILYSTSHTIVRDGMIICWDKKIKFTASEWIEASILDSKETNVKEREEDAYCYRQLIQGVPIALSMISYSHIRISFWDSLEELSNLHDQNR